VQQIKHLKILNFGPVKFKKGQKQTYSFKTSIQFPNEKAGNKLTVKDVRVRANGEPRVNL